MRDDFSYSPGGRRYTVLAVATSLLVAGFVVLGGSLLEVWAERMKLCIEGTTELPPCESQVGQIAAGSLLVLAGSIALFFAIRSLVPRKGSRDTRGDARLSTREMPQR